MGFFADVLLIFKNVKSWVKRRKQQHYGRKLGIRVKKTLYRLQKIIGVVLVIILAYYALRGAFFLSGKAEAQTTEKLSKVVSLLEHEKETTGKYPEQLETIIRNNPLLKNVHMDYWNRAFFYERHPSGERYILYSLGKDGKPNTEDDITVELKID